MARFTFNLPDIGEGITEAEIVEWHVSVGDSVAEDARLADMMTDKATVEMESPVAGRVLEVAGEVGDVIAIGSPLVVIETECEAGDSGRKGAAAAEPESSIAEERPSQSARPEPVEGSSFNLDPAPEVKDSPSTGSGRAVKEGDRENSFSGPSGTGKTLAATVLASPAVRKRASDLGVDLRQVRPAEGSRIRHGDLDAFLAYNAARGYGSAAPVRPDERVKVVGLRRRIAENVAASKRHIPHFSYVEECDVTELEKARADLNEARGANPKLTLLPLLIAAICRALPEYPMLNARFDDEANVVTRNGAVHVGLATMTGAGLMVPVIRDAQGKNLWQLAREIARLAEAAREGKARSEELSGSTITITSLGPLGGIASTPVINRPEVAIIAPNRIVDRPAFVADGLGGERLEKRKLMNLSISCDHRVVDGFDAAAFVQAVKRLIEAPALILVG